jgi:hypothetical protein
MMADSVSEFDVLLAVALWLKPQVVSESIEISPPRGQQLSDAEQKARFKEELTQAGYRDIVFRSSGPDIIVRDIHRIWKVECKGLSAGARSTVDNNFDRALSSVVSYYDEPIEAKDGEMQDLKTIIRHLDRTDKPIRLVLALPESPQYLKLLRDRVRQPLRRRLDLWLLIFNPTTRAVTPYDPSSDM